MALTEYTYTKEANLSRLEQEIRDSEIVTALDHCNLQNTDELSVWFKDELSSGDEDILDSLVSTHENEPLEEGPKQVEVISSPTPVPFAAKVLPNGKKLFRRKHGVSASIPANSSGTIELAVPYNLAKINKIEIVNCAVGDTASLKVYDNENGTISGVPNYMLNQFGFDVALPNEFYVDESNYDADLILGMKVELTYTNNSGQSRTVGMNVTLHELV